MKEEEEENEALKAAWAAKHASYIKVCRPLFDGYSIGKV